MIDDNFFTTKYYCGRCNYYLGKEMWMDMRCKNCGNESLFQTSYVKSKEGENDES